MLSNKSNGGWAIDRNCSDDDDDNENEEDEESGGGGVYTCKGNK